MFVNDLILNACVKPTEMFICNILQVWTQKCAVQKASVDVNISYY